MNKHNPIEINLHQKSRLLEISFDSGENYKLSCEYLRTHARSAEVKASDIPIAEKINVNITDIEPQGNYALRLFFDDAYDQGIYLWETLYELGKNQQQYWSDYLATLEQHGLTRGLRWERSFADDAIQFTVNKEFSELFTILEHGDEIALIPKSQ